MTRIGRILCWLAAAGFLAFGIVASPEVARNFAENGFLAERTHAYLRVLSIAALVTAGLLALAPLVPGRRARRIAGIAAYVAAVAVLFEATTAVLLRVGLNTLHTQDCRAYSFHPSLVGLPTPGYSTVMKSGLRSHNSTGQRGAELGPSWNNARLRIAAVGGSTTYDIGVDDDSTWVRRLDDLLGPRIRVGNFGAQAHSSAEHLVMTDLILSDYHPDVILYFMGWNDLRSAHTPDLAGDYPFHQRSLYNALLIDCPFRFTATGTAINVILDELSPNSIRNRVAAMSVSEVSSEIDGKALDIYRRNIRLIASAARAIGAVPVFVPQVWSDDWLQGAKPHWWAPTIPQRDLPKFLEAYNDALIETAGEEGVAVLSEVLSPDWRHEDFVDFAHFGEEGAARFARAVADALPAHVPEVVAARETADLPKGATARVP